MPAYTTLDLINSVKTRMMLPDASSGSFSPAAILQLATEELQGPLVTMVLAARESYYETFLDQAVLSNVSVYPIPSRAIGGQVALVQLIANSRMNQLPRLEASECYETTPGSPRGFYFQNNNVVIYPPPSMATGVVRMRYTQRPSRLEQTINCAQITAVSYMAQTVTCASVPTSWGPGTVVDFCPIAIPYTPYGLYSVITGIAANVVSFAALPVVDNQGNPFAVNVGDWLAIAEYTPIPEILNELFTVLAQMTAVKLLEAGDDAQALSNAQAKLKANMESAAKLIQPRDVLTPKKITSQWRNF